MTYLANVTYRITERLFWIPFKVYRQGYIIIKADCYIEAQEKMEAEAKEDTSIYTWEINKAI